MIPFSSKVKNTIKWIIIVTDTTIILEINNEIINNIMFKKLLGKVKLYGLGKKYDINKTGKNLRVTLAILVPYIVKNHLK